MELSEAKFTKDKGKVFSCFACGGGSTMGYKLAGFDVIGCPIMKKILNILLGVILLITVILTVYAMVAGGSNEAINLNLIWSYILIAVGIATALFTGRLGYGQQFQRHQRNAAFDTSDHRHRRGSLPDRPRTYDRNSGRRERRLLPAS